MMKVPYKRLSNFYGLYFALLGCIVPFWGLYLQQQSFSAEDTGILLALFSAVRIFAPNLWAVITRYFEKWLKPIQLLRLAGCLMLGCFVGFYWATEFWHYALVMVCYGFFWSAILPQYEVLTLNYTKDDMGAYSTIRLWGSVGFILLVSLLGWAFDFLSINYLPAVMLVLMILIGINSFLLPNKQFSHSNSKQTSLETHSGSSSLRWGVISFFAINVLLQACHGPYYVFFSIYLQELGYSSGAIGLLWSLGVLAEILIFWKISFFVRYWSLKNLVIISLILTAIRWVITALYADQALVLIFSQCLHAFSFGLLHAVSVKYIAVFFSGNQQHHGQALYSGLGFGLGGAIGAYLAGAVWSSFGASWVFMGAGLVALFAALLAFYGLPNKKKLG